MANKNIKELVAQIKRMAQAAPPPPAGAFLEPAQPKATNPSITYDKDKVTKVPVPGTTGTVSAFSQDIKEMQTALVNFAQTVLKTDIDSGADLSKNNSIAAEKMKVVREEAQRLAPANGPKFIDGRWGPVTDSLLHSSIVLITSLLSLLAEFPVDSNLYSQKSLEELKSLVGNKPTNEEKIQNAPEITKNLNQASQLYVALQANIQKSETFQPYESDVAKLTPQRLTELNNKFNNMTVKIGENPPMPITVHDLVNMDTILAWRKKNLPHEDLYQILTALKQSLSEQI